MNTVNPCPVNMKNISIPLNDTLPSKQDDNKTVVIPSSTIVGRYTMVLCAESKLVEERCSSRYSEFM